MTTKTRLYHAHPGECVVPPTPGWYCPYGTKEAAEEAATRFPAFAIRFAYDQLCNMLASEFAILFASLELMDMTTAEFTCGKDKDARRVLELAFEELAGHPIEADPYTASHDVTCEASYHVA